MPSVMYAKLACYAVPEADAQRRTFRAPRRVASVWAANGFLIGWVFLKSSLSRHIWLYCLDAVIILGGDTFYRVAPALVTTPHQSSQPLAHWLTLPPPHVSPLHVIRFVLLFDAVCSLAKMKADPNFSAASSRSELEKLVGRRINPGVSLAEQQERFPFLKDAPVEHAYAAGVKVRACTFRLCSLFCGPHHFCCSKVAILPRVLQV